MKKWLENYWYHYKWPTIISVFFIVVFGICISQIVTRENYDIYIRYVGNAEITGTQYNDMESAIEKLSGDKNGDGKSSVNFARIAYISNKDDEYAGTVNPGAKEQLSSMLVQPYYIYIMDIGAYEEYKDSGVFTPLSDIFGAEVSDDIAYDKYAVRLSETSFSRNSPGTEWISEDKVMVLKIVPRNSVWSKSRNREELASFNAHAELFRKMVNG